MTEHAETELGFWGSMGVGAIFLVVGTFIVLLAADVFVFDDVTFFAPRWVVAAAGVVFILGGFLIAVQGAFGSNPEGSRLYHLLMGLIMTGFLLIFASILLWVGFGPGEREFVTESGRARVSSGRLIFGGGGIISLFLVVTIIRSTVKKISEINEQD